MPGDNIELNFELKLPLILDKGMRFALREGGKTIAAGIITDIQE